MMPTCSDDPNVCLDLVLWFIAEFFKDWTTMAMLAILLALLLKLRADQEKVRRLAHARQMEAFDEKRKRDRLENRAWEIEDDRFVERQRSTGED